MRSGYKITLVELFAIIAVVAIVCSLIIPAMDQAREAARRMSCSSNIRQMSVAMLGYEYAYKCLPALRTGYGLANRDQKWKANKLPNDTSLIRYNCYIALNPFMESSPLHYQMENGYTFDLNGQAIRVGSYGSLLANSVLAQGEVAGGPYPPTDARFPPNYRGTGFLRCPSNVFEQSPNQTHRTNYAFNLGDSIKGITDETIDKDYLRGPFSRTGYRLISEISDGTSNTIMMAEIGTAESINSKENPTAVYERTKVHGRRIYGVPESMIAHSGVDVLACQAMMGTQGYTKGKQNLCSSGGIAWLESWAQVTGFNTILPPNFPSCVSSTTGNNNDGVFTVSSYHVGGAHVVKFDGTVLFIPSDVDVGRSQNTNPQNYYAPGKDEDGETDNWDSPSPFGVWGALGTRAQREPMPEGDGE